MVSVGDDVDSCWLREPPPWSQHKSRQKTAKAEEEHATRLLAALQIGPNGEVPHTADARAALAACRQANLTSVVYASYTRIPLLLSLSIKGLALIQHGTLGTVKEILRSTCLPEIQHLCDHLHVSLGLLVITD